MGAARLAEMERRKAFEADCVKRFKAELERRLAARENGILVRGYLLGAVTAAAVCALLMR